MVLSCFLALYIFNNPLCSDIISLPSPGSSLLPHLKFIVLFPKVNSRFTYFGPSFVTFKRNEHNASSLSFSSLSLGISFIASALSSGCAETNIHVGEFLSIGGIEWYLWEM